MLRSEEMQPRQPVLAINHQILSLGLAEMPDGFGVPGLLKTQHLIGKQQDCSGDHRLRNDRFIEIYDLLDLLTIQYALKAFLAPFNAGDELRNFVVLGDPAFGKLLAFKKIAARESNLLQQIDRLVRDKVKGAFLLTNPSRKHGTSVVSIGVSADRFYADPAVAARRETVLAC